MFNKTIFFILVLALFYGCGGGGETTTGSTDTTPPTVLSISPGSFADGVAVNSTITATFSEAMTASTVSATTFTINNGGVTGAVTYSGTTATFTPSSNLAESTNYAAIITTGVKDAAGNAMAADFTWTFTTGTTTTVSFTSDIQPIFTSYCISCHTTSGTSSFLPLTSGVSYNNLVSQTSTYTPGGTLVISGNSVDSMLYKRISGNSAGAQMPKGMTPLNTTDQNLIQTWIDEGANNN